MPASPSPGLEPFLKRLNVDVQLSIFRLLDDYGFGSFFQVLMREKGFKESSLYYEIRRSSDFEARWIGGFIDLVLNHQPRYNQISELMIGLCEALSRNHKIQDYSDLGVRVCAKINENLQFLDERFQYTAYPVSAAMDALGAFEVTRSKMAHAIGDLNILENEPRTLESARAILRLLGQNDAYWSESFDTLEKDEGVRADALEEIIQNKKADPKIAERLKVAREKLERLQRASDMRFKQWQFLIDKAFEFRLGAKAMEHSYLAYSYSSQAVTIHFAADAFKTMLPIQRLEGLSDLVRLTRTFQPSFNKGLNNTGALRYTMASIENLGLLLEEHPFQTFSHAFEALFNQLIPAPEDFDQIDHENWERAVISGLSTGLGMMQHQSAPETEIEKCHSLLRNRAERITDGALQAYALEQISSASSLFEESSKKLNQLLKNTRKKRYDFLSESPVLKGEIFEIVNRATNIREKISLMRTETVDATEGSQKLVERKRKQELTLPHDTSEASQRLGEYKRIRGSDSQARLGL
jgi:hypothetical protein